MNSAASTVAPVEPLLSASPESVGLSSERLDRIAPIMQSFVDAGRVACIATAVMRRGRIAHLESVGWRDLERHVPVTRDTIFRIRSMTKPITSVAAMILYEEGEILLTDPISEYLPQFKDVPVYVSGPADNPQLEPPDNSPTIQDLLRHTAGFTGGGQTVVDSMCRAADVWNPERTLEECVDRLATIPLMHQPGEVFHYGTSTNVLGLLVQVVSGMPFETFLQERIFAPLDMIDTGFYVPAEKIDRFAKLYEWTDDQVLRSVVEKPPGKLLTPPKCPQGGGGLVSTVDDYLRFCQMILNGGEFDGQRIIMPATVRYMLMDHLRPDQHVRPGKGYGLGFGIVRDPVAMGVIGSVGEANWAGAVGTFFWIDPSSDLIYMLWTQLTSMGLWEFFRRMPPLVHTARLD